MGNKEYEQHKRGKPRRTSKKQKQKFRHDYLVKHHKKGAKREGFNNYIRKDRDMRISNSQIKTITKKGAYSNLKKAGNYHKGRTYGGISEKLLMNHVNAITNVRKKHRTHMDDRYHPGHHPRAYPRGVPTHHTNFHYNKSIRSPETYNKSPNWHSYYLNTNRII